MSVLTDMVGNRSYVACLSFLEPFTLVKKRDEFENADNIGAINISGDSRNDSDELKEDVQMEAFYPKCLCLVSRYTYFDILKVGVIFSCVTYVIVLDYSVCSSVGPFSGRLHQVSRLL